MFPFLHLPPRLQCLINANPVKETENKKMLCSPKVRREGNPRAFCIHLARVSGEDGRSACGQHVFRSAVGIGRRRQRTGRDEPGRSLALVDLLLLEALTPSRFDVKLPECMGILAHVLFTHLVLLVFTHVHVAAAWSLPAECSSLQPHTRRRALTMEAKLPEK